MMKIRHVAQPPGTTLCGQCVVAMLLGVSLEEACSIVGTREKTWAHELAEPLRARGFVIGEDTLLSEDSELKEFTPLDSSALPRTAIVAGMSPDGVRHWWLWHDGKAYDPELSPNVYTNRYMAVTFPATGAADGSVDGCTHGAWVDTSPSMCAGCGKTWDEIQAVRPA